MLGSLPDIHAPLLLTGLQVAWPLLTAALLAALLAALAGAAARAGVRSSSDGRDRLSPPWAFAPPFLGGLAVWFFGPYADLATDAGALSPGVALPHLLDMSIGAVLMSLAATDRQTAWAPDGLLYSLAVLVGVRLGFDPDLGAWTSVAGVPGALIWAGIGAAGVLLAQVTWLALGALTSRAPPPPDLVAFALGPALLGFGLTYAVAMILISLILFGIRLQPGFGRAFQAPSVAEAAAADLGYEVEDGTAVPLLAVMLPVYLLSFLWICPAVV